METINEIDSLITQASKVKEKIIKVNEKLNFQSSEIEKTELLLEQLHECYSRQKQTLCKLSENKQLAIEELNQLIAAIRNIDDTFDAKNANLTIDNSLDNKEVQETVSVSNSVLAQLSNQKRSIDSTNIEITHKRKKSVNESASDELQSRLKYPLVVTDDLWKTITKIVYCDNALFICGSHGLLMRFTDNEIKTFKTKTKENIINVTIFNSYVVAFSEHSVISFTDIPNGKCGKNNQFKSIVGHSHLYHSSIYFPLINGEVWNFNIPMGNYQKCFTEKNEVSAILKYKSFIVLLLKDGRVLQRISSKNKEINDMRGSKYIGNMPVNLWYSYSDSQLWIASQEDCLVTQVLTIQNQIRLVDCNNNKLVILDKLNQLQVYQIENQQIRIDKIIKDKCKDVSALTITEKNEILVAKLNTIHRIEI